MQRLVLVLLVVAASALPANALGAANEAPPYGISATTMKLERIFARHKIALGAPHSVSKETWIYSKGELAGTRTLAIDGDDYREDMVLGPFHTAHGSYHGRLGPETRTVSPYARAAFTA